MTMHWVWTWGGELQGRGSKEGIEQAVKLFRESLAIDPGMARAWTSLSWCYAQLIGWTDSRSELKSLQLDAARRAVELDPLDAYAHAAVGEAMAMRGEFAEAETEYDKARNLSPNSADILTLHSSWASTFGKPESGVEAAQSALRLNPNVPAWALTMYRNAFFAAGHYEQALKMQNCRPRDNYSRDDFVARAVIFAVLGREAEAQAAAREAVVAFPGLSVEGYVGQPDYTVTEREKHAEAMRKAGFPVCASKADLQEFPNLVRLPTCVTSQTKD